MRRLRARPRIDTLSVQQRVEPVRWGRRIYLGLIALMFLSFANYFFGDFIFLRAEGLVVSDTSVVAATFPGKITKVHVREGQHVNAGDLLLEIDSADMLKDIAHLTTQNADLSQRVAELGLRASTAVSLLPLAERHARQAGDASTLLDSVRSQGLVTQRRTGEVLDSQYQTAARVAELRSQSEELNGQLPLIEMARQRAASALQQLEAFYDGGYVRAARSGIVGARVPLQGQVVKFGDELLQIFGGTLAVVAYLPDSYLFQIDIGQAVRVKSGLHSVVGTIDAVLTVADSIPPEFQNMFRPRDRSRPVKISLPATGHFAVSQKVSVNALAFDWYGTATSSIQSVAGGIAQRWAFLTSDPSDKS